MSTKEAEEQEENKAQDVTTWRRISFHQGCPEPPLLPHLHVTQNLYKVQVTRMALRGSPWHPLTSRAAAEPR